MAEAVEQFRGPDAIVGFSTHNQEQMRAAEFEPVDYVAFGPVFTTASKDRPDPTVGPAAIEAIRALTARPLVAIGGITLDTAADVIRAGAASVAVISDLLSTGAPAARVRAYLARLA